jgi:energy-coupling factor transport system ATP-binding protein
LGGGTVIINFENVCFTYPNKSNERTFELIIENFSPGLCTAVLGENGSGKTTLGKLVVGILRPNSGRVLYNREDIANWKLGKIGQQIGYLFQEPSRQIFAPNPIEEIAFPLELRGMSKPEAEKKARELLAEFGLENIANSTTYTLSRGEKQRLAIASIMACEPRFFVLDEPNTGLDMRQRNILSELLKKLMSRSIGVLIISHDLKFVEELGADIRFMKGGRLIDES